MSISTKDDATPQPAVSKPEDKRENLKKLRAYHQPVLDKLGLSKAEFIPKLAYPIHGKTGKYIALFHSEVSKGQDLYIEFADQYNLPQFEDRNLYKLRFNAHFEEEYEKTEPSQSTGLVRYLVPIAELELVTVEETSQTSLEFNLTDPEQDLPMDQMTMRDYAAIHMRKPVSRKSWLNELIIKNP